MPTGVVDREGAMGVLATWMVERHESSDKYSMYTVAGRYVPRFPPPSLFSFFYLFYLFIFIIIIILTLV